MGRRPLTYKARVGAPTEGGPNRPNPPTQGILKFAWGTVPTADRGQAHANRKDLGCWKVALFCPVSSPCTCLEQGTGPEERMANGVTKKGGGMPSLCSDPSKSPLSQECDPIWEAT